jgi:OmpA-OmpF porin, OOP family
MCSKTCRLTGTSFSTLTNLEEYSMKKQFFVLIGALTLSMAASAQQMYGTAGFGQSNTNIDCEGVPTCDRSGTAFKLMGGYKFAPNMAAELGYMSFGKAKASDAVSSVSISNSGFGGGVAFTGDLSPNWTATARVGLLMMKTKLSASSGGASGSVSDDNAQLYAGLGVGYKVAKDVSIDGYIDLSNGKYDKDGFSLKGNVRAIGVGVTFGF